MNKGEKMEKVNKVIKRKETGDKKGKCKGDIYGGE
jgi:hypothetical protein